VKEGAKKKVKDGRKLRKDEEGGEVRKERTDGRNGR
jgi:hypothetical protein